MKREIGQVVKLKKIYKYMLSMVFQNAFNV